MCKEKLDITEFLKKYSTVGLGGGKDKYGYWYFKYGVYVEHDLLYFVYSERDTIDSISDKLQSFSQHCGKYLKTKEQAEKDFTAVWEKHCKDNRINRVLT